MKQLKLYKHKENADIAPFYESLIKEGDAETRFYLTGQPEHQFRIKIKQNKESEDNFACKIHRALYPLNVCDISGMMI